MYGSGKYSRADLVAGPKDPRGEGRQLSNGATAGYVMGPAGKKVWRIIDAPASATQGISRARKQISKKSATIAFNKYWKARMATANESGRKYAPRGVASAMGRDILYGRPSGLRTTTSYKRNPAKLEYKGVDFGTRRYKAATGARAAALARGRAGLAQKRATGGLSRIEF